MSLYLGPNIVASIVDREISTLLSIDIDVADIVVGSVCSFGFLCFWLDPFTFSSEEERVPAVICVVIDTRVRALELHEAAIRVAVDSIASLELRDLHLARANQLIDLCANLVAVPFVVIRLMVIFVA